MSYFAPTQLHEIILILDFMRNSLRDRDMSAASKNLACFFAVYSLLRTMETQILEKETQPYC